MSTKELIKKRAERLKREAKVSEIESASLLLKIGQSKSFPDILDVQTYSRIRVRFHKLKNNLGIIITTSLDGNKLTVTRKEDLECQPSSIHNNK